MTIKIDIKFSQILKCLIIFTGIFLFKMPFEHNAVATPQIAWFILSGGILFGYLIYKENKYLGLLCALMFFSFFRTILFELSGRVFLYESLVIGVICFLIYYVARKIKIEEKILKLFMIPTLLNCGLIYTQYLIPDFLPFIKTNNITGLLGNAGFSGLFLGMTAPIFIRYFPLGLIFILMALLMAKAGVGLIMIIISLFCYILLKKDKPKKYILYLGTIIIFGIILFVSVVNRGEIMLRLSMALGTLHGIMRHPFAGWGLGSFISIVARIPAQESVYLGVPFNSGNYIMNHPHNEFLFGWWNLGILFIPICFLYIRQLIRMFTIEKITTFLIILSGFIIMLTYFFNPPTMLLMILALAIYENEKESDNYAQKKL